MLTCSGNQCREPFEAVSQRYQRIDAPTLEAMVKGMQRRPQAPAHEHRLPETGTKKLLVRNVHEDSVMDDVAAALTRPIIL